GDTSMSNAFFHRGLVIEFNDQIPRLSVDGQEIPLPPSAHEPSVKSVLPGGGDDELVQHARRYVDDLPEFTEFTEKRDSVQDHHVSIIKDGTARWNEWRRSFPQIRPLLYDADLDGADLRGANLANANMIRSRLRRANLADANLHEANLAGADL